MRHSKLFSIAVIVTAVMLCSFSSPYNKFAEPAVPKSMTFYIFGKPVMVTYVGYYWYQGDFRLDVYANTSTNKVACVQIMNLVPMDYNFYYDDIINNPHTYTASPRSISGLLVYSTPLGTISDGAQSLSYP